MRRFLFCLLLCSAFVQPVEAQTPVWGVFHSIHTTISDGTESITQRTDNLKMYCDFASTVDHDYMIDSSEWFQTIEEVNAYQSFPDFLYFAGYEWAGTGSNNTEITVFFPSDSPSIKVNGNDPSYDTFDEFAMWISQNNGIGCINHPTLYSPVNWSDPGVQNEQIYPCVEMLNRNYYQWSDQWVCAEGSGCNTYDNPSPARKAYWLGSVKNALDIGLRLGFVAGWDYHGGYPGTPTGYTGLADVTGWTKEAVAEAVRKRHTWAAEDRIRMNVTSGPYIMGDAFDASGEVVPVDYDIWAASGKTIDRVNIFVDGIITKVHTFTEQENVVGGFNIALSANKHYVFLEAIQSDGRRAWSSPMYITVPIPCGSVVTWEGRVSEYSDDAEEALSGEMYLTSTDLELINDSEWRGEQVVGIRFSGVDIPQGVTIHNAYIQFEVDETSSEPTSLRIVGENVDNAATFTESTGNVSSRLTTSVEVPWYPVAWTTVGEAGLSQMTPDISSIIAEISDRAGWSRGNSMAFLISGTGKRVAVAYDGDRYGAPLLHVEYSSACSADNPVPTTISLNPSSGTAGGLAFTLTVNGRGFVSGSVVRWNGANQTTTFVSTTQLTATIPASDIVQSGTVLVTVFNPAPGGGTSNAQTFTVNNPDNPMPATTSLDPSSGTAGGPAFTLTVNGRGFVSGSVVRWNGANRTTTFVSTTQLTATIPASDIVQSGTVLVTVFSPVPGGGTSNAQTFTVNQSVPANMHIGDLDGVSKPVGAKWWTATVTIRVHDGNHNSVQKATVKGTWSGPISTTNSCTTDITGTCSVTSNKLGGSSSTVAFTVTNVTQSSLLYTPAGNHDPDGESNGTIMVVSKPK